MRVCRWIIIIYVMSIGWISHAQDWTIWLYDPDDGFLLHLESNGTVIETRSVPTAEGYQVPHTIVFSHDQHQMATVAQADGSYQQRLTLYNVGSSSVIFAYDLPALDDLPFNADDRILLSDNAFRQDDQQIAFVSFLGGIGWTIHVVDTTTGEDIQTLPYDHPQIRQLPNLTSGDIPRIAYFQDQFLSFYIDKQNIVMLKGHSYTWFMISDQVRETIAFPNANFDVLATGEFIYPLPDKRFPSDNEAIPIIRLQHNALYVYQSRDETRYPAISRPELDLIKTWFIQGGERILIEAWEDDIRTRWLVYDRNGKVVRTLPNAGYDITATEDGFVYLTKLNAKTVLVHVDSRTFETAGDTVWVDEGNWQIVSVTSVVSDNLLPFAQLENAETPPPFQTGDHIQPTPLPSPTPLVYVGREMQIQVLDDGYINLRDDPSTDGAIQALLEHGLYVDIVDGPVKSGIYTWWKVRLSGREGWLVEEVEGTQVLIPRKEVEEEDESDATENEP